MVEKNKILKLFGSLFLFVSLVSFTFAIDVGFLNSDPYPLKTGKYADLRISLSDEFINFGNDAGNSDTISGTINFVDSSIVKLVDEDKREQNFVLVNGHDKNYYQLFDYRVLVSSSAPKGNVTVKFRIDLDNGQSMTKSITINVDKDLAKFDIGNVVTIPEKLYADTEDVELSIDVTNFGESDLDYMVGSISSPAIESANAMSTRYSFGTLEQKSTKTGVFYIDVPKDVKAGNYNLSLKLDYVENNDVNLDEKSQTLVVPITILGKPDFEVTSINNEPVVQGKTGVLKVNIRNFGADKAERLTVDLIKDSDVDIDFDKYVSYVGDLDVNNNGEAYFTYSVDRNAEVKQTQVILSLRYNFEDKVYTKTFPVLIDVEKRNQSVFENPYYLGIGLIIVVVLGILFRKKVNNKTQKKSK